MDGARVAASPGAAGCGLTPEPPPVRVLYDESAISPDPCSFPPRAAPHVELSAAFTDSDRPKGLLPLAMRDDTWLLLAPVNSQISLIVSAAPYTSTRWTMRLRPKPA